MFPLPAHIYFELAALLFGIIFLGRIKNTLLKWFVVFLGFIVLVEFYGRYLREVWQLRNAWLYNISIPIEYLFYAILFSASVKSKPIKLVIQVLTVLFLSFVLINVFYIQGFTRLNTNMIKAGSFLMIVVSCLYLTELLRQEGEVHFLSEPLFWISAGVLLFNTGDFFYFLFSDYFIANKMDRTRHVFKSINNKLLWVLYSCIIISFLCTKRKSQRV